ncbi:MAG TPA: transcription termination/antitermination NusG family protein [Anaerolineales bacterium]|nr:transcription termination/antitermination NusG family protein [Anaerolineales bacterium]
MTLLWYAMRSKPNKEDFLAGQLLSYGVEVYYPKIRVSPVNPRARKERPYFPNYLFVHVDLEIVKASTLQWMPGASGLVSFGGEPASVPDPLIAAIKQHVEKLNASFHSASHDLKRGEKVVIEAGPFAGYEAIFDVRLPGRDRVRVLLNLLQKRQVPLELESKQIRRVKRL